MKQFYVRMLEKFWTYGVLVETVTEGMIRLIPKSINKIELKDQRPLLMLDTDYKIIARILPRRLQIPLRALMLPKQTCFIKIRNMLDNVMHFQMAQDATKTCDSLYMFVKLDFEKACDRLDHSFV